jgi:hypothetical protein
VGSVKTPEPSIDLPNLKDLKQGKNEIRTPEISWPRDNPAPKPSPFDKVLLDSTLANGPSKLKVGPRNHTGFLSLFFISDATRLAIRFLFGSPKP